MRKMHSKAPIVKDLVLLGGGHSHVEVVRNFGMKPMPGVRITLVTRDVVTPYSGMLPGYVSGFYSKEDCHIDLARLTAWAGVRMVCEEACGLDVQNRRLQFKERPALAYDALSINIGITPGLNQVPGAAEHCTPVKPIDGFVRRLDKLLQRAQAAGPTAPLRVVVVGGGAGGVEIALAVQYRLDQLRQSAGADCTAITVTLVCRGRVLASHTSYARASLLAILAQRGVVVREFMRVSSVTEGRMQLQPDGPGGSQGAGQVSCEVEFEECLWCTQAAAPSWLKTSGLPTDAQGFLAVDPCLHSQGGPLGVFAAGDVASCAAHPRPKAGVFAVRQGPPLTANLRRFLLNQPLQPFVPQTTFLSLITTGDRYCVGTKGWMGLQGRWMWWWKDSIDRAFMRKYGDDLPVMAMSPTGASVLSRALARLPAAVTGSHVVAGLESPDDAALLRPPPHGKLLVQTLDFFKVVWDDPYVFGKVGGASLFPPPGFFLLMQTLIAATHALGDVWAMGGQPRSALALAVVPLMAESKVEEELVAMMAGALQVVTQRLA
ncbi:hypothetical protein QJQ45_001789 [Haematococcus lacustris]|nr:hypothetical protein QJQ45_001789 [Haematococcus lacustris]